MTFTGWCRSVINGWHMQQTLAKSLHSLRSADAERWLPRHPMPDDELDASIVNFSLLARVHGMPIDDVAAAVRAVRKQARAHGPQRHGDPQQ